MGGRPGIGRDRQLINTWGKTVDMLLILLAGIFIGWLTTLAESIPTAKAADAWVREKLAAWKS